MGVSLLQGFRLGDQGKLGRGDYRRSQVSGKSRVQGASLLN